MANKINFQKGWPSLAILFVILSGFLNIPPYAYADFTSVTYQIKPSSTLEVNGSTNVNSFCCASQEQFSKKKLHYKIGTDASSIIFQNTFFKINTLQLDCGKKLITKDMRKLLQTDQYPQITISLVEAYNLECDDLSDCDRWVEFDIRTDITITCKTQVVNIPVLVKKLDIDSYRIMGGTSLQLCDFDLEAPTTMLGLIQVNDVIEINFDLYVDLIRGI